MLSIIRFDLVTETTTWFGNCTYPYPFEYVYRN